MMNLVTREKRMKKRQVEMNIQASINECLPEEYLQLDSSIYEEGLIIGKPVKIVGEDDTIIRLNESCVVVQGQKHVVFENITFEVTQMLRDAAFVISESHVTFKNVRFIVRKQNSDTFNCIWLENADVTFEGCKGTIESNFLLGNQVSKLILKKNQLDFKGGTRAIELNHIQSCEIHENQFKFWTHGLALDYLEAFSCLKNHFEVKGVTALKGNKLLKLSDFEEGNLFEVRDNKFVGEMDFLIGVTTSQVLGREYIFEHNEIMSNNGRSIVDLSHLNGSISFMHNKSLNSDLIVQQCERLVLGFNEIKSIKTKNVIDVQMRDNTIDEFGTIEKSETVLVKKNKLLNTQRDQGGLKFVSTFKLHVEKNQMDAHGIQIINGGDNKEVFLIKNVFSKCKTAAITFKALKVICEPIMIKIKSNIISNNVKGIHIDDPFIKTCHIEENFFEQNKTAATVIGGKTCKDLSFTGNYFDHSNQIIEAKSAVHIQVMHNELNNSALRLRNAQNIMVHGNRIDTTENMKEKHDVCIKAEGNLIISENIMLRQKTKFEKRDVSSQLSITAFERRPRIEIFGNKVRAEFVKRGLFEPKPEPVLALYPDESLKSTISHQIYANGVAADDVMIDDAMKQEFYHLKSLMEVLSEKLSSVEIKQQVEMILRKFNVEIFVGKDQNDIYRFMLKSKETIELLEIYMTMVDDITPKTEMRILSILKNYSALLDSYCQEQTAEEQDKLKAQIKLLENLL